MVLELRPAQCARAVDADARKDRRVIPHPPGVDSVRSAQAVAVALVTVGRVIGEYVAVGTSLNGLELILATAVPPFGISNPPQCKDLLQRRCYGVVLLERL
jgi:hypothetical protein